MEATNTLRSKRHTSSGRMDYLDALRGICVILIVVEHHLLGAELVENYLYSFSLTPFFLISGFLFSCKKEWEQPFRRIAVKYLKRLIYPYVAFSIVNFIWNVLYYKVVFPTAVPDYYDLREMLLYTVSTYGYNALWYLPCMFWGTLLFAAVRRHRHHRLIWGCSAVLLVVFHILFDGLLSGRGLVSYVYSYLFRAAMAMVFLYAGHLLFYVLQHLEQQSERRLLACGLVISAAFLALYLLCPEQFPLATLASHRLGNPYAYYPAALAPSVVLFILCRRYLNKNGVFAYFGRNSMVVMALHMDIFVRIAWYVMAKLHIDFGETANSLLVIAMELVMSPVFIYAINRYFPFLLKHPQRTGRIDIL